MHIVGLVEAVDHVCTRYRLRAFAPALAAASHTLEFRPLPGTWLRRWTNAGDVRSAAGVILQRKLLSPLEIRWLRGRVRQLWFDMDDALWLRDSYATKGRLSRKRERRFRGICSAADVIVCGNQFLADNARRAGAARTIVIPTCVAPDKYPIARHVHAAATMVWVGSSSTLQGIQLFGDQLEAIGRQVPGIRLKLICDRFVRFAHLPVVETKWSETTEAEEIAAADIGISWIPEDDWSRGKCGLKVLQYMAAGLPVVTNPVGVHTELVQHGETGYLARSPADWIDAMRTLASDPELRRRMGAAGRRVVEQRYSVAAGAAAWLRLIAEFEQPQGHA